ncbi:hypothetical protein MSAN_01702600 [Mycena sanguinolenta]|uniref:Uncharacterized protein n=1 Tax=Mycena sanguinolenta TaxID=230812 RepID=A0A8H6XWX3_9AGAR|nr:hypothetical protein MSAN_01702600 [Mycena sanguinolenta]
MPVSAASFFRRISKTFTDAEVLLERIADIFSATSSAWVLRIMAVPPPSVRIPFCPAPTLLTKAEYAACSGTSSPLVRRPVTFLTDAVLIRISCFQSSATSLGQASNSSRIDFFLSGLRLRSILLSTLYHRPLSSSTTEVRLPFVSLSHSFFSSPPSSALPCAVLCSYIPRPLQPSSMSLFRTIPSRGPSLLSRLPSPASHLLSHVLHYISVRLTQCYIIARACLYYDPNSVSWLDSWIPSARALVITLSPS